MMENLYETHVTIAADTAGLLRRCDVCRLIESSQGVNGMDPQLFADWLMVKRPDLSLEVRECLREIGQ